MIKHKVLTVTLDEAYSEEDLGDIITAIAMIKGVQQVHTDGVASARWQDALNDARQYLIEHIQGVPRTL